MTRDEALTLYRPIRAAIRNILSDAVGACNKADFMRAEKQLGCWSDDGIVIPESSEAAEMVSDVALFEPNQRGKQAYDRFLSGRAQQLSAPDLALAQRMAEAVFSIFRCAGRHEAAGVWLEDVLDGGRRLWIMDEGLEKSAAEGVIFATRLFNAGPFHAGFGIIAHPDAETVQMCVRTQASSSRHPFRHSLAATLYGDKLRESLPITPEQEEALLSVLDVLLTPTGGTAPEPRRPAASRGRDRARK